MITKSTVLILGAGASRPFDYLTGKELKRKICNNLESWAELFQYSGIDLNKVRHFKEHLEKSPDRSVDAFLEHRPEFLRIGKMAIARVLIPFENESTLFDNRSERNNWYEYLFNKMSCQFEEFENNKLSVVTFNYDRSIEYYFFTGMQNKYGKNFEKCTNKLKKIPIIRLHGQLGYLPWQSADSGKWRQYSADISERFAFREAAELIKIISENIGDDPEFTIAHELIEKAEVVYFLGFGYNDNNLQRLNIKAKRPGQIILGSSFGLGIAEIEEIKTKWKYLTLADAKHDVLSFLRNCAPLL
jgi:hypothetical protein